MGRVAKPLRERLFEKVEARGPDECWPWTRSLDSKGYGRFMLNPGELGATKRVWVAASRAAFMVEHDADLNLTSIVDHECHNRDATCKGGYTCTHRACCNPAHLRGVTHQENLTAGRGGHREFCPQGHELTAENLSAWDLKRGWRKCRTCNNDRARARYQRRASDVQV